MKRSRGSSPCSIRASRCSQSPVSDGEVSAWSSEQPDDAEALLGADQRAAVALDVADVDQALDDRRAGGGRADPGVLHRLAQLVVVDELAGGLHRAQQRRVGVAPRRLGDLLLGARPRSVVDVLALRRASGSCWSSPSSSSSTPAPSSSRSRRRRRASRPPAARGRGCGRRARRPSSPAACSRTPRRDGRRRGSAARPCRRCAGRRRRACRACARSCVGMIAWWSVTFASLITRPSGSTSSPVTYAAAFGVLAVRRRPARRSA